MNAVQHKTSFIELFKKAYSRSSALFCCWFQHPKEYKSQNLPNGKQMETQYELCVLNEIIFLEAKFFSSGKHEKMFSNSRRNIPFVLRHPNEQTKTNLILKFRD